MKKIMSVILAAVLILTALPAFANQSEEMEKVLLSVKARIENTDNYEEFNSSVQTIGAAKEYSFDWVTYENDKRKTLNISANENSIIISYRKYDESTYSSKITPSLNKMPAAEAMTKALDLINKLNPMLKDKFRLTDTSYTQSLFENTYRFNLQRYENDIPVYGDTGSVVVNNDATQIISYNIGYTENLSFENADNLIGIDGAWQSYSENVGAELEYVLNYNNGEEKIELVYLPKLKYDEFIDAKNKEIVKIWEREYYFTNNKEMAGGGAMTMDTAVEETARLSEIEMQKIQEVSGLKLVDEAIEALVNSEILDLEEDLTLNSANLYHNENKEYFYDLRFESREDKEYRYALATVNAKTLEVIRFRARTNDTLKYNQEKTEVDKNDISEKVKNALEILYPDYSKDYRIQENENAVNNLSYNRYVNDIIYRNDYINIEINPDNGKVWNFSKNYTDKEFVSPEGIISEADAIKAMSEKVEMTLYYFPSATKENALNADFAELGYKCEEIQNIDAFSGKIKAYSYIKSELNYTDIENHYAKEQIETLARFGIGFEGTEFKPNEKITQKEYISLLISTFNNYSPIILKETDTVSSEYKQAQRNGVILPDDVKPDEPLTREKSAIYMIRVMGIEEVAKLSGIYKPLFSDVSEHIGYISILGAMGVFNGDENGLFNPKQNLTRADAAILIYNYLSR